MKKYRIRKKKRSYKRRKNQTHLKKTVKRTKQMFKRKKHKKGLLNIGCRKRLVLI